MFPVCRMVHLLLIVFAFTSFKVHEAVVKVLSLGEATEKHYLNQCLSSFTMQYTTTCSDHWRRQDTDLLNPDV